MAPTQIPPPPESWASARRVTNRIVRPLERFLHVESASGMVLLAAAVVALVWANSPWSASHEHFWHTPVTFGIGSFTSSQPLQFWINDGLMTVFFFVVGLEIRREIYEGELSDRKRAVLPVVAALGGRGWGVPVATDIAFAVGVLALLGRRVPPALRVLLLALAIIDDIGAIIVIALFYSSGLSFLGLAIALAGVGGIVLFQRLGIRRAALYLLPGAIIWLGILRAGVHPTIAGVVIGLLTPARSWFGKEGFLVAAGEAIDDFRQSVNGEGRGEESLLSPLKRIKEAHREVLPPVVRIQAILHPWVAFGIMPLFALANAGVHLGGIDARSPGFATVMLGVALGLVVGKPLGIVVASFASVKLGICTLPRGVSWIGVAVVGLVAGIGFTMAIFIAGLAFPAETLLATSKLAILLASALAAVIGLAVGRLVLHGSHATGAASSVQEAEVSTVQ